MAKEMQTPSEEMIVELELDDGSVISCDVITVLEVDGKDYIALLPKKDGNDEESEVWFYGLKEDPSDPNVEPELIFIEDEAEYEAVADKFDEFLDTLEFEEM